MKINLLPLVLSLVLFSCSPILSSTEKDGPAAILVLAEELEIAAKGKPEKTISLLLGEFDASYEKSMLEYWDNIASSSYKQFLGNMKTVGWQVLESEGLPYISNTGTWYQARFKSILPIDWKVFLDQQGKEIAEGFAEDAAVIIPWEEVRKRIEFWEKFQDEYRDFPKNDVVQNKIRSYACAFFGLFDNSPIDIQDSNEIDPEIKTAYERFLQMNQSSRFFSTLKEFYQKLEENSFIVTDELKEFPTKNGVNFR